MEVEKSEKVQTYSISEEVILIWMRIVSNGFVENRLARYFPRLFYRLKEIFLVLKGM